MVSSRSFLRLGFPLSVWLSYVGLDWGLGMGGWIDDTRALERWGLVYMHSGFGFWVVDGVKWFGWMPILSTMFATTALARRFGSLELGGFASDRW